MDNSIIEIIDVLKKSEYYGAGESVEIAKGRNQVATTWKQMKTKVKRDTCENSRICITRVFQACLKYTCNTQ